MDVIKTGVFEISTSLNEFWTDWQVELAKEDMKRRARAAIEGVQRDGVPYTTCLYPIVEKDSKLVLMGFCVLTQHEYCDIGEATVRGWTGRDRIEDYDGKVFELEARTSRHRDTIYIYRRVQ